MTFFWLESRSFYRGTTLVFEKTSILCFDFIEQSGNYEIMLISERAMTLSWFSNLWEELNLLIELPKTFVENLIQKRWASMLDIALTYKVMRFIMSGHNGLFCPA